MSTGIFATEAPKYWNAGLPAIPLVANSKRPAPHGWQVFADQMPSEDEKAAWLRVYANGNIGLPLGAASGLVAVDVDSDDPLVLRVLDTLLPPSPFVRVGRKGYIKVYKYNGERTTRIQTTDKMICEILSKGTQFVLPHSIHPDTQRPYTSNVELYSVLKQVPSLPKGFDEMLRVALLAVGIDVGKAGGHKTVSFVPAGQRDNSMVFVAGVMARAVTRGERTLLEVLGEMKHWVETYVERVVGDPLTVDRAQQRLIAFIVRDVTGTRKLGLPPGWDEGLSEEDKAKLGLTFTDDNLKWGASQIMEYLAIEFVRFPDADSEGQQQAIAVALDRIARSEGVLTLLDEERLCKFIATQTSGVVSAGTLKKQIKLLRKGDIEGENHDEIAREVHKYVNEFGELRYHVGSFWQWKGACWEKQNEDSLIKIISNEFGFYPACRKASDYSGVLRLLRALAALDLCQDTTKGINFANGYLTVDLVMMPHHPDYGVTYVLPYRYMPELAGNMSMCNRFMTDSWGHDPDYAEKVMAFQEAMGTTLFSAAPAYQKAFCLFGQAGSGKTVASQLVRALLPQGTVSAIPPEDWVDRFLPAGMFGKVLNFAGELSESKYIPGEIFKQIIEGEMITAQNKNQQPFSFRPTCAQWFNSNHLPKTRDTSGGFNRRWLFLEWTRTVLPENRIPGLAQMIVDHEREAIAAWAVQGYARVRELGDYTLPSSHMALVDQMATENNSVRYFLATCPLVIVGSAKVVGKRSTEITANNLYTEYWSFCLATGIARRVASNVFVRMMHELQPSFDFRIKNRQTAMGTQEVYFDGITLVG